MIKYPQSLKKILILIMGLFIFGCSSEYDSIQLDQVPSVFGGTSDLRLEQQRLFGVYRTMHATWYLGIYPEPTLPDETTFRTTLPLVWNWALFSDDITTKQGKVDMRKKDGLFDEKCVLIVDNATENEIEADIDKQKLPTVNAHSHYEVILDEGLHTLCITLSSAIKPIDDRQIFLLNDTQKEIHGVNEEVAFYVYNVNGENSYTIRSREYKKSN